MNGLETIEDKALVRDILEREQKTRLEVSEAVSSLSNFSSSTKLDYLNFLQKAMEMGSKIESDWSNFMFDGMYTIDKDFEYSGKTCGANSLSFILKEGCSLMLKGNGGHETVYDMNLGIERSIKGSYIREKIAVPRECLASYKIMRKYNIKPNWLISAIF